ncbi:MAG TPA: right-handed parallel beta-helix repeat-containing protein [Bacillales bacterium]|nr:right-handed parallel beta-helix repeat-containing protein [Bacillales bacterium]
MNSSVYELELSRWGVYNNGSHPIETTKGINAALVWAKDNGFKTFKIPDGTYLIAKGTQQGDPESRINMVSDMDLLLSDKTILRKESNEFEMYSVLYLGVEVKNVTIKGGTVQGDRDTHDYSKKGAHTAGTHEWGYGIELVGVKNVVVDGVKLEKFTGDGLIVSGTTITGTYITESQLESGGIDDNGNPIAKAGKVRSNSRSVTNFDNPVYQKYRNIYFWFPEGVTPDSTVDVYYYRKDGSFIKTDKDLRYFNGESIIPTGADYFRAVFDAPSTKGVKVNRMTVDISKHVTIKNCDIGYNRRQGISLVGSDSVEILQNHIHHTSGTAPQSGIDIEPGFYPGNNTVIKWNKFAENKIQIVLAYGENALIEGNTLNQTIDGGVGVHVHEGFRGDIYVNKNRFNGSGLTLKADNITSNQNTFLNCQVSLQGKNNIISNSKFMDASLAIGNAENQKAVNLSIQHNGVRSSLYLGDQSVHLKNVHIKAKSNGKGLISGVGNNNNVYEGISVEDSDQKGTLLPAGAYHQSFFDAGCLTINRVGRYELNDCIIKSTGNLLSVNSTYGKPDVIVSRSNLEITENIGYGAAIYILGAGGFELLNSILIAQNNTINTPLIKIGPYGYPLPTKVFTASIKENVIITKINISGIDTSNAGTDAPPYLIENNTLYNAKLSLKTNDINQNNQRLTE